VTAYQISEHRGSASRELMMLTADGPVEAIVLAYSLLSAVEFPLASRGWRAIDDQLGGAAAVDPADADHCLRADPRKLSASAQEELK